MRLCFNNECLAQDDKVDVFKIEGFNFSYLPFSICFHCFENHHKYRKLIYWFLIVYIYLRLTTDNGRLPKEEKFDVPIILVSSK